MVDNNVCSFGAGFVEGIATWDLLSEALEGWIPMGLGRGYHIQETRYRSGRWRMSRIKNHSSRGSLAMMRYDLNADFP